MQDIEAMGKKATFGNNITLTPDECDTLKRYAVNGIIANADNKRLKEKLASAEKTVSIWKQRYEAVNENIWNSNRKPNPFWMHWKSHPKEFGLLFLPSSPEKRKQGNLKHPPASVDRTWNFDGGIAY